MENLQNGRPEEHARALDAYDAGITGLPFCARFSLYKTQGFYGPGTHRLLQLTQETGSVLEACRKMGISYSKGRRIIALSEEQLGFPLLKRQQGGRAGGHSFVTEDGERLMHSYQDFCTEAEEYLNELFKKYF